MSIIHLISEKLAFRKLFAINYAIGALISVFGLSHY